MTRMGRPRTIGATADIRARVPAAVRQQLERIARDRGWSISRAIREAVTAGALALLLDDAEDEHVG